MAILDKNKWKTVSEICEAYSINRSVFYRIMSRYNIKSTDIDYNKYYNFYQIDYYITNMNTGNMCMKEYLKRKQVAEMLNVCTKTIDNYIKCDNRFPKPINIGIGNRTFRWLKSEIDDYIGQCKAV